MNRMLITKPAILLVLHTLWVFPLILGRGVVTMLTDRTL